MSCSCGRSPTGKCVGWHDLTEKQYAEKKAAYEARQASKAQATLFLQASDTGQK